MPDDRRVDEHAVEAGGLARDVPAVPDPGRDVVKRASAQLEGGRLPPALVLERADDEPLAAHERGQVERVQAVVGVDVPPALAGVGVADEPDGLRGESWR